MRVISMGSSREADLLLSYSPVFLIQHLAVTRQVVVLVPLPLAVENQWNEAWNRFFTIGVVFSEAIFILGVSANLKLIVTYISYSALAEVRSFCWVHFSSTVILETSNLLLVESLETFRVSFVRVFFSFRLQNHFRVIKTCKIKGPKGFLSC